MPTAGCGGPWCQYRSLSCSAEANTHFGYTSGVMSLTASEVLVQLDSLRERLKEASGRLGWLRSYL
jgi:hypothetical protein